MTTAAASTDVVVIGAGAAGLSAAVRLSRSTRAPRVVLIEPPVGDLTPPARTWCSWSPPTGPAADAVSARWTRGRVVGPAGQVLNLDLSSRPYVMVRSDDFARVADTELGASPAVQRLTATVDDVADGPTGVVVRGRDAGGALVVVSARWALDSRPPAGFAGARTVLLQHFRGWFVTTDRDMFDPDVAVLMDFRPPQPSVGVAFGYVLPTSRREALVEYTEFSPQPLDDAGYDAALRSYTDLLSLGEFKVTGVERGVIPMTDAPWGPGPGASVSRIGAGGGATRGSTGYTFAAAQRQVESAVARWEADGPLRPDEAYPRRHRWMDAVLLRALATGRIDGAQVFTRLFEHFDPATVLDFLDGRTGPAAELALMRRTPPAPMARTAAELPFLRRRQQ